jgi:hypothetical protein
LDGWTADARLVTPSRSSTVQGLTLPVPRARAIYLFLFSVWFSVWQQGNLGEVKALKPASSDVDAHKG